MSEELWERGIITKVSGVGWSIITPDGSVDRDSNILVQPILAFSARTGSRVEFVRATGRTGWIAAAVRLVEQ